ncbi:hypothetical protein Dimus_005938, partial [Dionaea muscipula]
MCQLKRKHGIWWLEIGGIRRRDDNEVPAENVENVEMNKEEATQQEGFDWIPVENEAEIQGEEHAEKGAEVEDFGSGDKFYDAMSDEGPIETPHVVAPAAS